MPWPHDKPFKILSFDGGGIRGIYGASLMASIENEISEGQSVASYFDMIAGTSTGGILALALGLNIPAKRIVNLYQNDGEQIFHQNLLYKLTSVFKLLKQFRKPLYDFRVLEKILLREFGDYILGQSTTRLIIPAFICPKAQVAVFKTDHHPDFKNDWKSKAWEIARATSAAPTYFYGHQYDNCIFLDGGVWANNPIMLAIIDALSAYDLNVDQIEVMSVGTGNFAPNTPLNQAKGGLWQWRKIMDSTIFFAADNALAQATLLIGPDKLLRLEPSLNFCNISMDDWANATRLLPTLAKNELENRKEEIKYFFTEKVYPREKFYT